MTLQPGQTLGRYQILEPLGVGGMATVYKAYQPSLEREVALKVLRPGFAEDPEFFERFQREARSIARLRHPNIVQIFDFEPLDGRYVLAMEFLEGGTLKERVTALAGEGKRLPKTEIARIVGEVAEALGYGHELGIVHRDVKPSNVMLTRRDRAVVTDFGIAKIVGGEGQTQTGVGIGTPEYMAPEQGSGAKVDQRADIYSLGVMAYEMLTGRVPFVADTPLAVVLAHVRDPLPLPSTIDPSVEAATERVLLKALAKDPADRYETAPEFADALKAALVPAPATAATSYPIDAAAAASATPAIAPARGGIPRNLLIGAAVIALLLAADAAYALTRGGTAPGAAGSALLFELDPPRAQQQLQPRGAAQLRPVTNGIEMVLGPRNFSQVEPVPQVYTSDLDATLRVRLGTGSGRVGMYFHSSGDGDLQLTADTQGQLALSRGGTPVQAPSLATYAAGSAPGKELELRVVVVGTAITMYVDGKEVGRATSPEQRTGGVGLVVGSFDSGFTAQVLALRISGTAVANPVGGPPGQPGAPGPQASPGQTVAMPSKGALLVQVNLTKTTAVFGTTARNKATIEARGLRLDAADDRMGLHAPPPSEATGYGDFVTELRFAPVDSATPTQVRIVLVGSARPGGIPGGSVANIWVSARVQQGRGLQIEIMHDQPSAGGARPLAQANLVSSVPAPTMLVMRRGQQLAVFVDGQFAASATDPLTQVSGIDLELQPIHGTPGTQEPSRVNSAVIESWAIYRIGS